ncbi:hypothetical protein A3G63_02695 [Candidatus Kaiserbacteria bacterium RIFCSPLOWO2_12_FULL_52_8]|uniref:Uncharacterized protein n=1 Tax=Candidatus Kaiserbacteria bacterium RIFCSPHIGHO2_01_FULL_53_31 TaxID=1798481 RepID=A0A1F6CGH0_9BACT|nr:MAG: hypothetical protein A2678_02925 [Candidatus Kaiserbacteria bacterium RIFCSPHIGHO2_01_FULL_53_31]OGG92582.1 MAG: hypothetical protein A3G63_02695 [Candidatus Kaiserbacteria bacterium RIFCSPLOWO2_12_FULL_52_8]
MEDVNNAYVCARRIIVEIDLPERCANEFKREFHAKFTEDGEYSEDIETRMVGSHQKEDQCTVIFRTSEEEEGRIYKFCELFFLDRNISFHI